MRLVSTSSQDLGSQSIDCRRASCLLLDSSILIRGLAAVGHRRQRCTHLLAHLTLHVEGT